MAKKKFYVVKKGRVPGIYESWDECKAQTDGFAGADYKGFETEEEAKSYFDGANDFSEAMDEKSLEPGCAVAYVDGSFDEVSGCYSSGLIIFMGKEEVRISHKYDNPSMASMRNVAGEIMASVEAMRYCLGIGIKELTIYHDYEGIAKWPTGAWKTEKEGTKAYKEFYDKVTAKLNVKFVKVKGHSGNTNNDVADYLAKEALGLN
ncbi:MAG: ribonuclease H family protein [Lachnospiraceae bacterium]|nr:ribonuclease H family protein [Lachnospiraceae bacterium]